MFSRRTRWERTRNRLAGLLEEKRRAGAPLLDLTESNPTRAGLAAPADVLAPLADAAGSRYDPAPLGLVRAREAVAADYRRRGVAVDPERVVLTASTSEAYGQIFKLLCDPGDRVLVPAPSYPLFEYLAGLEGVALDRYPLRYDGEWHVSLQELVGAANPRTRAILLVNPGNPTGSYLKRQEAEALCELAAERQLAVLCDEVFGDYSLGDDPRRVTSLAAPDGPALAFSLGGLSKSCGLPQVKLAWFAVAGPRALREEALARLEIVADTYLSLSTPAQLATPSWLARLPALQAPIAARVRSNHAALAARLDGSPASLLRVEGGWSAVLRVPADVPEEERACRLLEERDVLVHPGYFFDFSEEAYLVVSLLAPEPALREGVSRILAEIG